MRPHLGGEDRGCRPSRLHGLHHGNKQFLLWPDPVSLSTHNDWMRLVDGCYARVPLEHSLAGGQLGRLVGGAVRLPAPPSDPSTVRGVRLKPRADLLGLRLESLALSRLARAARARRCEAGPLGAAAP